MGVLIMQKKAKNMIEKIFIKNMKTIRDLDTKSIEKMINVYGKVKIIFSKPLVPIDEIDDEEDEQQEIIDMPQLESEESAEQRRKQEGQGLKILTQQQMLTRLPISLAQLKAGSNSQKPKNEIRQLLYSLYRSKKLSKTV